ncbi:MAG TPA: hypothetical protein VIY49_06890 [Bryobacteraceae bacterium]
MKSAKTRLVISTLVLMLTLLVTPIPGSWLSDVTGINIDVNKQIGTGISAMSAPTAQVFEETGNRLIVQLDQKMNERITQIGGIAQVTLIQFQGIVNNSMQEVDELITKQLTAADELLERRIGTIDTIAVKDGLALERIIQNILLAGCLLILLTCAVWRLWKLGLTRVAFGQIAMLVVGLAVIYGASFLLPHQRDAAVLRDSHLASYNQSLVALDFNQANFHVAQLKALDPTNITYVGYGRKVELLRDILTRPALYQTPSGFRSVDFRLKQASELLKGDPDLRVLGAFMAWQGGRDRRAEYLAAELSAGAIEIYDRDRSNHKSAYVLRSFAVHYLKSYLLNPLPVESIKTFLPQQASNGNPNERLFKILDEASKSDQDLIAANKRSGKEQNTDLVPDALVHIVSYGELTRRLYQNTMPDYAAMITYEARLQTDSDQTKTPGLKAQRDQAAARITSAWEQFSAELTSNENFVGTTIPISALNMNDAIYTRAKTYMANATATTVPALVQENVQFTPLHVAWTNSILKDNLTGNALMFVSSSVTAEFVKKEASLKDLEDHSRPN